MPIRICFCRFWRGWAFMRDTRVWSGAPKPKAVFEADRVPFLVFVISAVAPKKVPAVQNIVPKNPQKVLCS
jgi:hypothetical protein